MTFLPLKRKLLLYEPDVAIYDEMTRELQGAFYIEDADVIPIVANDVVVCGDVTTGELCNLTRHCRDVGAKLLVATKDATNLHFAIGASGVSAASVPFQREELIELIEVLHGIGEFGADAAYRGRA